MNTYMALVSTNGDTMLWEERCEWCHQPPAEHGPERDDDGDPVCPPAPQKLVSPREEELHHALADLIASIENSPSCELNTDAWQQAIDVLYQQGKFSP
jgi:hypothetical protein